VSPGRRPVLLLAPLIWVAVVVVVATVTWRVIDSAGRQVLTSDPLPSLGAPTPDRPRPSSSPTHRPDATPSPGPTRSTSAGTEPSPSPKSSPSPSPSPSSQATTSPMQVRSWQGVAGTVTAACEASRITLQSVTPNNGWAFAVGDRGPENVEVELTSRGEGEQQTHVRGGCISGAPRFVVTTSGSSGTSGGDGSDD